MGTHRVAEIGIQPICKLSNASRDLVEVHVLLVAVALDDEHLALEFASVRHGGDGSVFKRGRARSRFKCVKWNVDGGKSEATQMQLGTTRGLFDCVSCYATRGVWANGEVRWVRKVKNFREPQNAGPHRGMGCISI